MSRILAQHGNVIAADFRPRASQAGIEVRTEILYCDRLVCLMRFQMLFQGEVIATEHITAQA